MSVIETAPLGYLAVVRPSSVDKVTVDGETPVSLCNYTDIYYGDRITQDLPLMQGSATADEIRRFELCRDDVLVTKDSESADDIGIPAWVAEDLPGTVLGYHASLIRPRPGTYGRFVYWALQAQPLRDYFEQRARGVTRYALRQQDVTQAPIPHPALDVQRRIADYLDAETGRIDALLGANRRARELLAERVTAHLDAVFNSNDGCVDVWGWASPESWRRVPLYSLTMSLFRDGDWIEAPFITESGVRLLQTGPSR